MKVQRNRALREAVKTAFLAVNNGRSTDDIIIDDELAEKFTAACHQLEPEATPFECNWTLFQIRKSSRLGPVAKRRAKDELADYVCAAEIAARQMEDKYSLTIDRVFCHPQYRIEFDGIVVCSPKIGPAEMGVSG